MITLRQKVTNRELALHGQEAIRRMVLVEFMRLLVDQIHPKLELNEEVCEVVPQVDYTLPPFRFSEQFGIEYSTSLVVLTVEELREHERNLCQSCALDQVLDEEEESCFTC